MANLRVPVQTADLWSKVLVLCADHCLEMQVNKKGLKTKFSLNNSSIIIGGNSIAFFP